MSRRRLERGYWNNRQVEVTPKEENRIYVYNQERGRWYHRFSLSMSLSWPWPTEFETEHRIPRKTKKALWKQFNGHPKFEDDVVTPGVLKKG